jgi:hypothetical protein
MHIFISQVYKEGKKKRGDYNIMCALIRYSSFRYSFRNYYYHDDVSKNVEYNELRNK